MKASLSIEQARKLVILSQKLPDEKRVGSAKDATLSVIEHLGYIQIDAISVIERAHHHTIWNRNPRYEGSQLDQLVAEKKVFEYWSHAASYLPMRDYRYSLPRKRAFASGEQEHWYECDSRMMKLVLKRIENEGPLMAKDFEHSGKKVGEWKTKPAKKALENLFMQGDLMCTGRVNFHKVYDLRERALPDDVDTRLPEPDEYARFLIKRFLTANGIGLAAEIAYLLKGIKPLVSATLKEMVSNDELLVVRVVGVDYYALPASLELLNQSIARRKLNILSPFDNLVIQRKRLKQIFGFEYLIECYVPAVKRQYGYFSLPILWDGELVARMDCKVERKTSVLHVLHLAMEPGSLKMDEFILALRKELNHFIGFNQCVKWQLHRTTPSSLKSAFLKPLDLH